MSGIDQKPLTVQPRTSLSINIMVLRVLGVWFPEEENRTWRSRLYILHAIFTQGIIFYLYMVSELINMYKVTGNIVKMCEGSFLLLTHFGQAVKNYHFYKYSRNMVKFLDELESDVFVPKNTIQKKILKTAMNRAQSDSVTLLGMALATCALWAIFPFMEESDDGTIRLPLSGWYPAFMAFSPYFQAIYCYQIIAVTCNAFSNISMDTIATGLLIHICAQIDILKDSLENMKEHAVLALLKKKQNEHDADHLQSTDDIYIDQNMLHEYVDDKNNNNGYYTHAELETEMFTTYRNCVIHHQEIIRYAENIEEIFNMSFLAQFAASLIIICLTLFSLTLVKSLVSLEFASLLLYQACIVFELLLYCWHGNEMVLKSDSLSQSAYNSGWYEFSPKFARGIILLMARSKKPIRATSGKFFTLSLATFTAILRNSWSYFAVLNQMDAEE